MASKLELAPTVRAYECGNSIVVKYYDAAGSVTGLSCPLCHWIGTLELDSDLKLSTLREVRCPDCDTRLARVAPLPIRKVPASRTPKHKTSGKSYLAAIRQGN